MPMNRVIFLIQLEPTESVSTDDFEQFLDEVRQYFHDLSSEGTQADEVDATAPSRGVHIKFKQVDTATNTVSDGWWFHEHSDPNAPVPPVDGVSSTQPKASSSLLTPWWLGTNPSPADMAAQNLAMFDQGHLPLDTTHPIMNMNTLPDGLHPPLSVLPIDPSPPQASTIMMSSANNPDSTSGMIGSPMRMDGDMSAAGSAPWLTTLSMNLAPASTDGSDASQWSTPPQRDSQRNQTSASSRADKLDRRSKTAIRSLPEDVGNAASSAKSASTSKKKRVR